MADMPIFYDAVVNFDPKKEYAVREGETYTSIGKFKGVVGVGDKSSGQQPVMNLQFDGGFFDNRNNIFEQNTLSPVKTFNKDDKDKEYFILDPTGENGYKSIGQLVFIELKRKFSGGLEENKYFFSRDELEDVANPDGTITSATADLFEKTPYKAAAGGKRRRFSRISRKRSGKRRRNNRKSKRRRSSRR
jgi:hypothetical protein